MVQVSWSGVKNPSLYDAVAFVTPANAVYNVTGRCDVRLLSWT